MNEPREDNQAIQFSEKSKSSKWWIYVKLCICLFNLRIEVKSFFFSSFFEIFQATTPYHSKNYLGSFKIEPFCARLCVLLWLVSSYAGAIFIDFGTFFKHADGLQCWTWRFRLMYKCFCNTQFELPIDHYMISSYIEKINISNKANNIYQISEMKNLLHLKGCYFESILTLGLRI